MDKNEVVEILKELPERIAAVIMPSDRFFDYKGALSYAVSHLETDRWIPVSERLPEKEGWYLVDRKERTSSIQYFFFSTVNHKPYWSGECKVYYWRPLPEPYKEIEAENEQD